MKLSQYSFLLSNRRGYFLFSTLFFSIIEVDEHVYRMLSECKCGDKEVNGSSLGDELYTTLNNNGFLCESYEEEYLAFREGCINARTDDRDMHVTIVPTMNCCFSCPYCFEKHKKSGVISEGVIDSIIRYIGNTNPESLHITWFGGEPLLATRQIESFSKKLFKAYQGNYSSDIITTGFPVSGSVVDTLRTGHINDIQITIDGDKENHNKVKFTNQCNDTFSRIIDNIDYISSQIPSINCIIRVNVTKENINDIPFLHSKLSARFANRNIWLSPSLVMQNGCACSEQLFSSDEFRIITKEWWEKYKIPTKWIYGIDRTECAIRKPSSIVVLPDGSICRCWEVTGDQEYTIGKLLSDGNITLTEANHEFSKNLGSIDPFSIEKCKKCPYLPICYGGCPIKIIKCENNHGSHVPICTSYKGHLNDWLELYLDFNQR